MTVRALPHVACTVQPHPRGGYTPTLHLRSAAAPPPASTQPIFGSLLDAVRYARHEYRVRLVTIANSPTPDNAA